MEVLSGSVSMNSPLWTFLWGFSGSFAVEIASLCRRFDSETSIPIRYKQVSFWVVRASLAIIGGGLAVAWGIDNTPLLAFYVGASTPIIIQKFSQGDNEIRLPDS